MRDQGGERWPLARYRSERKHQFGSGVRTPGVQIGTGEGELAVDQAPGFVEFLSFHELVQYRSVGTRPVRIRNNSAVDCRK